MVRRRWMKRRRRCRAMTIAAAWWEVVFDRAAVEHVACRTHWRDKGLSNKARALSWDPHRASGYRKGRGTATTDKYIQAPQNEPQAYPLGPCLSIDLEAVQRYYVCELDNWDCVAADQRWPFSLNNTFGWADMARDQNTWDISETSNDTSLNWLFQHSYTQFRSGVV